MADQLWCVHVLGPDDMHPAPSKEEAERAAKHMTDYYGPGPHDPPISFEAKPWPYSETSHVADLKEFYTLFGLSPHPQHRDVGP